MPQSEPITILVVNELGEEIKLVTLSFRGFFPGCRVEAVYSLDEALQWAPRVRWHLLLIEERLLAQRPTPVLPELRRLAPSAAIVLQTDRSDSTTALQALQAGADFLLYKKSPAFLTELVMYTKEAMEKRELRLALERLQERHGRLMDAIGDVLYELDAEGRFVYLSASVTPMLGYAPEELTGVSYADLIPPDQWDHARHRFNDRRAGPRAARRIEVDLAPKPSKDRPPGARVRAELSAKGLYDAERHYLGTLGLLRDLSGRREQEQLVQHLQRQLQETDRLVDMARRISTLVKHLQAPLTAVLSQSQQLTSAIQEVNLDHQMQSLLHHATEAVRQGAALALTTLEAGATNGTLNEVLDVVLAALDPPTIKTDWVERRYASNLPPFSGNRDATIQLFRTLLAHAQRYLTATGSRHRLRISTAALAETGIQLDTQPALFPAVPPSQVEVRLEETEIVAADRGTPPEASSDLLQAYALVHQLGGRLEFLAPVTGLLSMTVWLPVERDQEPASRPPFPLSDWSPPRPVAATNAAGPEPTTAFTPSPSGIPDRRQAARASVHLPARITAGNQVRQGTVTNLSLGGAGILVEGALPSIEDQPVYVLLKTDAGMLELQGLAQSRGPHPRSSRTDPPATLLAFRFTPDRDIEQHVLASLMEEARSRTLSVTLEALLSLPDHLSELPVPLTEPESPAEHHRETLRVRVALPARVDTSSLPVTAQRPLALVVNVSRGGVCLQMKQAPGPINEVLSLHFSATGSTGHPKSHEPEAPEAVLTGRIVWMAPDTNAPSELRPNASEPAQRIGLRLVQLSPFAEREINRVVAQHIGSSMDLVGIAGRSSIVSARRECRNAREQVIAITDDHARHHISPVTPVVIVVPGFGKLQTDYLPLSYFLAANRLRVLRYDHTNHIGHSEGDVLQTTLRSMQVDLQTVLEFVRTTWPTAPLTVAAEDLGARVALKVMAETGTPSLLLLTNPVLDLETTLTTTFQHDVWADHHRGLRRGVANLWGLNVNLDRFLSDALAGDFASLSTSSTDLAGLAEPPIVLTTRTPPEHLSDSLTESLRALGNLRVVIPVEAEIALQPDLRDEHHIATFRTILKQIRASLDPESRSGEVREAPLDDIQWQQTLEEERIRIRHHVSQATRDALWIAHLAQLPQMNRVHDYWAVLEHLYRQLLPLEPGMTILDVGCAQGDLARITVTNQVYQLTHQSEPPGPPIRYIGLEQSQESLINADGAVGKFMQEVGDSFSPASALPQLVQTAWAPLEWDSTAPFPEGSFTRIVFHLSLSFCPSPLSTLRHAFRALDEQGTIVLTCLQPHTDFSALFRRHLRTEGHDEFWASSQVVLHYLARVHEAIRHGLVHSYARAELAHLLRHAGGSPLRIVPILDGQLLLAVARKGNSPG